jgi:hypothetical protein
MTTHVNDVKVPNHALGLVRGLTLAYLLVLPMAVPVIAQQTVGTSGSPSTTTIIDGKQLPAPDTKSGGVIKENAAQSKPWSAPRVVPPKGVPNVLLIMTDEVGFGAPEKPIDVKKRKQYGNSSDDLFERNTPFGSVQDK